MARVFLAPCIRAATRKKRFSMAHWLRTSRTAVLLLAGLAAFVGIAPEFAPLRSDERFLSILSKIGLEPEKVFASTVQHVMDGVAVPGKKAASPTAD